MSAERCFDVCMGQK